MGKIQLFLNNFYKMTFEGKGAFWGIVLAALLLVLVYMFADKLRDRLKKKSWFLLAVPAALLAAFVLVLVNASGYVPISERAEGTPAYAWEQTTKKSENTLLYTSDVKDPATGAAYSQTYPFGNILSQLTRREASDHVAEEYTVTSSDETAAITFYPDSTYRFSAAEGGAEETGKYTYEDKALTLTSDADGSETKVGKTSSKLRYTTADGASKAEFGIKELKEKFVIEESTETVQEAFTAVSTDETTFVTFYPDGTYTFAAADGGAEENGHYAYRGGELVMANAEGADAFRKNFSTQYIWLIFGAAVAAAMILIYVFHDQIKAFLNRHPMIWLLIPAALLIYFVYVAIGWNVWVSVSDWPDHSQTASYGWGGFGQYTKMFADSSFWNSVWNTLKLFLIIPVCLLLGLGLALVMDQGLRGTPIFRTLILLPFALSFVVTGLIWQQMFNGNGGILVEFFRLLGITLNINWTSNEMVMFSIMLVMVWQFSGYVAVIFLAAIKNVPTNIVNAAKLDGSYMPRIYMKMILPQLKGAMGSCITILAMYALRSFDLIYSLTSYTNPASATLPIMMYNEMYAHDNYAYAAAISCFLLAMVLVLILPLTYLTNRRKR